MLPAKEHKKILELLEKFLKSTDIRKRIEFLKNAYDFETSTVNLISGEMHRTIEPGTAVELDKGKIHEIEAEDLKIRVEGDDVHVNNVPFKAEMHFFVPGGHVRVVKSKLYKREVKVPKDHCFVIVDRGDHHLLINAGKEINVSHFSRRVRP